MHDTEYIEAYNCLLNLSSSVFKICLRHCHVQPVAHQILSSHDALYAVVAVHHSQMPEAHAPENVVGTLYGEILWHSDRARVYVRGQIYNFLSLVSCLTKLLQIATHALCFRELSCESWSLLAWTSDP